MSEEHTSTLSMGENGGATSANPSLDSPPVIVHFQSLESDNDGKDGTKGHKPTISSLVSFSDPSGVSMGDLKVKETDSSHTFACMQSLTRLEDYHEQATTASDDDDDSDDISDVSSSWSLLAAFDGRAGDSVAGSSTISGFDLISLSGSSKKKCNACSFLNESDASICSVCDVALVPNPCTACDEQVALYLQNKAQEQALEKRHQWNLNRAELRSGSLLARSQGLVSDIDSALRNTMDFSSSENSFQGLLTSDLSLLASRTLEVIGHPEDPHNLPFTLCYCFTEGTKYYHLANVFREGFGDGCVFGSTPEAAFTAYGRANKHKHTIRLTSISEDCESTTFGHNVPKNSVAWVVAVVKRAAICTTVGRKQGISSGTASLYRCPLTCHALPLAYSADPSVIYDDIARRLVNNLTVALFDFCQDAFSERSRETLDGDCTFETADEYALEPDLQAILYEDIAARNSEHTSPSISFKE